MVSKEDVIAAYRIFPQAALLEPIAAHGCRVLDIREDDSVGLSLTAISNKLLIKKVA